MNTIQADLICSAQRALITHVRPNLRVMYVNYRPPNLLQCQWYYDHEVDEDDHECATISDSEIWSDFPFWNTDLKIMVVPEPKQILAPGCCIYARYEVLGNNYKKTMIEPVCAPLSQDTMAITFCTLQAMMLGRVTPNLRRIDLAFSYPNILKVIFYYDQEPSELDTQLCKAFASDFARAYPPDQFEATLQTQVIPYPQIISNANIRRTIYARHEDYGDD